MSNSNYNKYIGARYVPLIKGEWDKNKSYEPLTVVTYQGASYTSKSFVPIGVQIANENYWVLTGNYNAQVELYRQDVNEMKNSKVNFTDIINDLTTGGELKALSAQQGKVINTLIENIQKIVPKSNGVDDTSTIQSLISQGGTIYFPEGTWFIDGEVKINVPSETNIIMHPKTLLKIIPNGNTHYTLFMLDTVKNVVIRGGKLLGERNEHTGTTGEFGFGIWTKNSENIFIEDLRVNDFWGDGIVLGTGTTPNKNIHITNVVCTNNRRQGLTVSHVEGLYIDDSEFNNTNGTAPSAGIDFEIDSSATNVSYITDVHLNNVKCKNNAGYGIAFDLRYTSSRKIDITIDNYYSEQTKGLLFSLGSNYIPMYGNIIINNANFTKFQNCPLVFSDWHSLAPTIIFNNPKYLVDETFNYTATDDWASLALFAIKDMSITPVRDVGNVIFNGLQCVAKPSATIKPKFIMANTKPSTISMDNATPVSNVKVINTDIVTGLQQDTLYFGDKVGTGNLFTHTNLNKKLEIDNTLTLTNGWTGELKYSKNDLNDVILKINITASSNVTPGTIIGTIPAEYRFKSQNISVIPIIDYSTTGEVNYLKIDTTGNISLTASGTFVTGRTYKGIFQYKAI